MWKSKNRNTLSALLNITLFLAFLHVSFSKANVIELDDASFAPVVTSRPITIVLFYATWCYHCHALMPEYERANDILNGMGIKTLAMIECSTAGKQTCNQLGIQGFPTIKYTVFGRIMGEYQESLIGYVLPLFRRYAYQNTPYVDYAFKMQQQLQDLQQQIKQQQQLISLSNLQQIGTSLKSEFDEILESPITAIPLQQKKIQQDTSSITPIPNQVTTQPTIATIPRGSTIPQLAMYPNTATFPQKQIVLAPYSTPFVTYPPHSIQNNMRNFMIPLSYYQYFYDFPQLQNTQLKDFPQIHSNLENSLKQQKQNNFVPSSINPFSVKPYSFEYLPGSGLQTRNLNSYNQYSPFPSNYGLFPAAIKSRPIGMSQLDFRKVFLPPYNHQLYQNLNPLIQNNPNFMEWNNLESPLYSSNFKYFDVTGNKKNEISPSSSSSSSSNEYIWNPDYDLAHRPMIRQYMVPAEHRYKMLNSDYFNRLLLRFTHPELFNQNIYHRRDQIAYITPESYLSLNQLHQPVEEYDHNRKIFDQMNSQNTKKTLIDYIEKMKLSLDKEKQVNTL